MVMPSDEGYAQMLRSRKVQSEFTEENLNLVRSCFDCLFRTKEVFREARRVFKERGVDFGEVFKEIDIGNKGFLRRDDFDQFLRKGIEDFLESDCEEVRLFMEKCDLDKDGKISFKDFYMLFSL